MEEFRKLHMEKNGDKYKESYKIEGEQDQKLERQSDGKTKNEPDSYSSQPDRTQLRPKVSRIVSQIEQDQDQK